MLSDAQVNSGVVYVLGGTALGHPLQARISLT